MRRAATLLAVFVLAAATALLASGCGGGSATTTEAPTTTAPAPTAPAAKPTLHVVVQGQDHHPLVGKPWRYEVRVTDAKTGAPVACRIHLQFLFTGVPVGEVGVHVVENGVWKETIGEKVSEAFPPAARGQPLVLQATVTAKGYATARAGWAIKVR